MEASIDGGAYFAITPGVNYDAHENIQWRTNTPGGPIGIDFVQELDFKLTPSAPMILQAGSEASISTSYAVAGSFNYLSSIIQLVPPSSGPRVNGAAMPGPFESSLDLTNEPLAVNAYTLVTRLSISGYAPRGLTGMVLRISKVTLSQPGDGTVTLDLQSDASIPGSASLYQPEPIQSQTFDGLEAVSATVRIAGLTTEQLDGDPDGVLVCAQRPNGLVTGYELDVNWETTTDFISLGKYRSFAILGILNRWRRSDSSGRLLVDVSIGSVLDQQVLVNYSTNKTQLFFVAMTRKQQLHSAVDQHQLVPGWASFRVGGRFALVSSNRWEIEVEPGVLSSVPFALENFRVPSAGYWPTSLCWIGVEADFAEVTTTSLNVFRSGGNDPSDVTDNRIFRFPTSTPTMTQNQTDATQVIFERNVATMNPAGTFTIDWGARAPNAEYVTLVCDDGATEYWRLSEATGTTALNYVDATNDGTYSGGFTLAGATPLALEVGDTSASFNGSSGLVALGNAASVALGNGSLELWVKTAAPGSGRRGLAVKLGAYGVYLYDGIPGWRDWSGSVTDHIASASVADGQWHYIVLTWQSAVSNGTKLYVDGSLVLTASLTVRDQLSGLVLAAEKDQASAAAQFLSGSLDEIAVYPVQLSLATIQAHYAAATGSW